MQGDGVIRAILESHTGCWGHQRRYLAPEGAETSSRKRWCHRLALKAA